MLGEQPGQNFPGVVWRAIVDEYHFIGQPSLANEALERAGQVLGVPEARHYNRDGPGSFGRQASWRAAVHLAGMPLQFRLRDNGRSDELAASLIQEGGGMSSTVQRRHRERW